MHKLSLRLYSVFKVFKLFVANFQIWFSRNERYKKVNNFYQADHFVVIAFISLFVQPFAVMAQLGERQTQDLKVPGSNPESSHEL